MLIFTMISKIRFFLISVCVCVLYTVNATAELPETQESVFHILGHGGLTAILDQNGPLTLLRWPGPGGNEQCSKLSVKTSTHYKPLQYGAHWSIYMDGKTHRLAGLPWITQDRTSPGSSIYVSVSHHPNTDIVAIQTAFIHPRLDVLVMQLELRGLQGAVKPFWYGGFSPRLRTIPGAPIADFLPDSLNDFACFIHDDKRTVIQFRPDELSSNNWIQAAVMAQDALESEYWDHFGAGIWLAATLLDNVSDIQCGNTGQSNCAYQQCEEGALDGQHAAVGEVNFAFAFPEKEPQNNSISTILLSFGKTRQEVLDTLSTATTMGYYTLLSNTLGNTGLMDISSNTPDDVWSHEDLLRHCVRVLETAQDKETGAIISTPATALGALDYPSKTVWVRRAYDMLGMHDRAEQHVHFLADTLMQKNEQRSVDGSIPALLYTDGTNAIPSVVFDAYTSAWFLWSVYDHGTFLNADKQSAFYSDIWPMIERAGDLLANWWDDRTHAPLPGFSMKRMRYVKSNEFYLLSRMGLSAAVRIAESLGHPTPAWQNRLTLLDDLLETVYPDTEEMWIYPFTVALYPSGVYPKHDYRWVRSALAWLDKSEPITLQELGSFALMGEHRSELIRKLENELARISIHDLQMQTFMDSEKAAHLAILLCILNNQ